MLKKYIGIDAGGTTFKVLIASGPEDIIHEFTVPTVSPSQTISEVIQRIRRTKLQFAAIGIGSFGPLGLDEMSNDYGKILNTPKPGWSGVSIIEALRQEFSVPVAVDTDVNAALRAETKWGSAKMVQNSAYVTIGTGIGVGIALNERIVPIGVHPEMGHIAVKRSAHELNTFVGSCPYHGDCLEGVASATAIERRWGMPPHELPDESEAWGVIADYLAQLCRTLTYTVRPDRIVLGGGVMMRAHLLAKVKESFSLQINEYGLHDSAQKDEYLSLPALGQRSGALGGIAIAMDVL